MLASRNVIRPPYDLLSLFKKFFVLQTQ